jgi:hypothetical protein
MGEIVGYLSDGDLICLACVADNPWSEPFKHCSMPVLKSEAYLVDCTLCGAALIKSED